MTGFGTRLVRGIGVVLVAATLSGCIGIPTSGPVHVEPIDVDPDEALQIALPESPVPGQSATEIVQGFLRAGRAPQNSYAVAREYLAAGAEWSGTERVLLSSSQITPVAVDADTVSVTVTVIAEVDATGRYSRLPSPRQQTLDYQVRSVGDEVRISDPAPGTVISPNGFDIAFDEFPLYFFDPSFQFLVPDVRWFPVNRTVADRIVRELLVGPTSWLGSGVLLSAFPVGATGDAVYDAPRVEVDLSSEVRAESALAQWRMIHQLDASLAAVRNAPDVVVTADGLSLAPAGPEEPPETRYSVQDVIGAVAGSFGRLVPAGVTPLSGIGVRADAAQPVAAALARDRGSVAVLGPDGVSLVESGSDPVLVDARAGLVAPSLDPFGYAWSVPAAEPDALVAVGVDGIPHPVAVDLDGSIVAIELSRDGSRLLVASTTAEGSRLTVAGVLRDANLVPVALLGSTLGLTPDGRVIDVAWVDGSRVAVLADDGSGPAVELIGLGGPIEELGAVDGGVAIVGGNLVDGLRVLGSGGMVLRPSGAGLWVDTGLVASFLGTQH